MSAVEQVRDLDADLAICEAATPGPWKVGASSPNGMQNVGTMQGLMTACTFSLEDARFIVAARTGWPYAIRRAMEAEAKIDRLENELNMLQEHRQRSRGCTG